ncbi:hypothetical protein FPQ18DRAFT_414202 [Pyronema domesticum]|nr:hypothetical protein FPQ18DRAFT_414202 [Pyronema domesticum]
MDPADHDFDAASVEPLLEHADEHAQNDPVATDAVDKTSDSPPPPSGSQLPVSQLPPIGTFFPTLLPQIPSASPAPLPPPATSTPSSAVGSGNAVAATPSLTRRAMGYPMQKACLAQCGLPLDGLLSWTELPQAVQEAAINRFLLLENIPSTTREFAIDHLWTQMGKYKDEKKRQAKRAAEKAVKANGTLGGNPTAQGRNSGFPTVAAERPVLPDNVFAGFGNRPTGTASTFTPAAGTSSQPAAATPSAAAGAATETSTPVPRKRGRPLGSKNRPKAPASDSATPTLILRPQNPTSTTGSTSAAASPHLPQSEYQPILWRPGTIPVDHKGHIYLSRESLSEFSESARRYYEGRYTIHIRDSTPERVTGEQVVATNEGQNVLMGIVTDSNDEVEEGEIVEVQGLAPAETGAEPPVVVTNERGEQNASMGIVIDSDDEVEEGEIVEERTPAVKRRRLN